MERREREKGLYYGYYPYRSWFWPATRLGQAAFVILLVDIVLWLTTPWNPFANRIRPFIGPFPFSVVWHYTLIIIAFATMLIAGYRLWKGEIEA